MKNMNSLVSLVAVSFAVSSFALAGCAAPAEDGSGGASEEDVASSSEALTLTQPTLPKIVYTDPVCTAKLVSTGPSLASQTSGVLCPAADPYTGQMRVAGYIENGATELFDQGQVGAFHCKPSAIVGGGLVCTKDADRVIEETCAATLTYECPCGMEYVTLSNGAKAAQCKRLQ